MGLRKDLRDESCSEVGIFCSNVGVPCSCETADSAAASAHMRNLKRKGGAETEVIIFRLFTVKEDCLSAG